LQRQSSFGLHIDRERRSFNKAIAEGVRYPAFEMASTMASTYLSLHYQVVFSIKHRAPLIDGSWQDRLHQYLGGTLVRRGGIAEGVGGIEDHVHMLMGLKATHCLADVIRELKKASSTWVHDEIGLRSFAWQEGYAAFTVSAPARMGVKTYIDRQVEHHRVKSFREELVALLEKAGIEYDPRHLD
jgi:putative transposase